MEDKISKYTKFIPSRIWIILLIGLLLVIAGDTKFFGNGLSYFTNNPIWFDPFVKLIGVTIIGSGVFTAIIKSSVYADIFSKTIEDIIWSKKFIERRADRKEIWGILCKLMYEDKFPLISDEIESIISTQYLPVDSQYYLEDYNFTINISNHNENFWSQSEVLKFVVRPITKDPFKYLFNSEIDLPDETADFDDLTDNKIIELTVNNTPQILTGQKNTVDNKKTYNKLEIELKNEKEYIIVLKRNKIVCKKTNPDKRLFVSKIMHNAEITVLSPLGMNIEFHKMGTTKDFILDITQINEQTKMWRWSYNGLILPHQGCIMLCRM